MIDEDDKPSGEELARDDKNHKGQKVSNKEWKSPTDKCDSYSVGVKADHAVDLQTEVRLSAIVMHSTQTDQHTLIEVKMGRPNGTLSERESNQTFPKW